MCVWFVFAYDSEDDLCPLCMPVVRKYINIPVELGVICIAMMIDVVPP